MVSQVVIRPPSLAPPRTSECGRDIATPGSGDAVENAWRHADAGELRAASELLRAAAASDAAHAEYTQAALAITSLRQGLFGHAVWSLLRLIEEQPRTRRVLSPHALEHLLAYAYAAGGAVDLAERRYEAAFGPRAANTPLRLALLCRRRRFSDVVAATAAAAATRESAAATSSAHALLGRHGERVVALLRAFAWQSAPGLGSAQRHVNTFLATARPT